MKKYISCIVCAILIVISIIVSGKKNTLIAGSGNGVGEKVSTVEELGDVLSWLSDRSGMEVEPTSYTDKQNETNTRSLLETETKNEYTSGSFRIFTFAGISSEANYNGNEKKVSMNMKRDMTCYFTQTACYYEVDAYIQAKSSSKEYDSSTGMSNSLSNSTIRIKENLYVDETHVLVYIEDFTIAVRAKDDEGEKVEQETMNFEPIFNKWIDMSTYNDGGLLSSAHSVTERNFKVLGILGSYMVQNEEEKMFSRSGNQYTLLKTHEIALIGSLLNMEEVNLSLLKDASLEVDFSVDVSTPQKPNFNLFYAMSQENRQEIETGLGSKSIYEAKAESVEDMRCEIFEINNTVVKMPKGKFYKPEDFGDLMQ